MSRLHRLPPLHALAAFESAARLGGFAQAAAELCITPSAVSHRIRQLESHLGESLFDRSPTGVRLTAKGQSTVQGVREIFDRLVDLMQVSPSQLSLTVGVPPTLARNRLIPNLPLFYRQWPEVEVQLAVEAPLQDRHQRHDVDVRFGLPPFDDRPAKPLFEDRLQVLVSPHYPGFASLREPSDLAQADLLRSPLLPWHPWLQAVGLNLQEPNKGPVFTDLGILLEAAASGMGVALCLTSIARHWVVRGDLQVLFNFDTPTSYGYFVLTDAEMAQKPEVAAFLEWLYATLV